MSKIEGRLWRIGVLGAAVWLTAAACSSSGSKTSSASPTTAATSGASSSPGTMFSSASVSPVGTVVVDGSGKTVYVLTADGKTNATCDDSSGCTKVWPDLPFPSGVTAATAGSGLQQSLLGSKKLADGETYPTYNGWLMYEFTGDSAPGTASGVGIKSFGGTWYALSATGTLVMPGSSGGGTTATTRNGY